MLRIGLLVLSLCGTEDKVNFPTQEEIETLQESIDWRATLFAGAAMLAVIAGIVVIAVDGGTSNHPVAGQQ